jgi:hypothetical protein
MDELKIPRDLRGSWMSGVEDAYGDYDTDPDSDGHGWERRALAAID